MKNFSYLEEVDQEFAKKVSRSELAKRIFFSSVIVGVIICVTLCSVTLVQVRDTANSIRETQEEGSPTLLGLKDVLDAVNECSIPGGKCFEQSRTRAQLRSNITNEIIVLANYCSIQQKNDTYAKVRNCVNDEFNKRHPNGKPEPIGKQPAELRNGK